MVHCREVMLPPRCALVMLPSRSTSAPSAVAALNTWPCCGELMTVVAPDSWPM
jgi:hypothetical protein